MYFLWSFIRICVYLYICIYINIYPHSIARFCWISLVVLKRVTWLAKMHSNIQYPKKLRKQPYLIWKFTLCWPSTGTHKNTCGGRDAGHEIITLPVDITYMMTSSNGNIFRVTGHFTGPRWIPRTKDSDAEIWCFLWSASEYAVE